MDETTTIDVDQVQEWSHTDDPVTPDPEPAPVETPSTGSHPAPDNDPYGWIAAQEADERPTVQSSTGEQVPVRTAPYVVVEQIPALSAPDKFDHAVAKVLPNGVLLVTQVGSEIPLKGYAPGTWATFEHVGPEYHQRPPLPKLADREVEPPEVVQWRQRQADDDRKKAEAYRTQRRKNPIQMTNYLAQANDPIYEATAALLIDPMRRTPPTLEQDADDTQSLSKVDQEEGGGVGAPKAQGVLQHLDAAPTGLTRRPGTGAPETPDEEPTPGRIRSLWKYLTDPDWVKD